MAASRVEFERRLDPPKAFLMLDCYSGITVLSVRAFVLAHIASGCPSGSAS